MSNCDITYKTIEDLSGLDTAEIFVNNLISQLEKNPLNGSLTYFNFKSFPACNLSYKQSYNARDNTIVSGCANVIDNYECSKPKNQKNTK